MLEKKKSYKSRTFLNRNKGILAIVQVEKEAGHVFVVDSPTSVGLILGDQLFEHRHGINGHSEQNSSQAERLKTNNVWTGILASPQYSEINSFFWTGSLMKVPHPATSDGAKSRC